MQDAAERSDGTTRSRPGPRWIAAAVIVSALIALPVPFLPPLGLARVVQSVLGVGWSAAYLAAAIGLQAVFYFGLGLVATRVMPRAETTRGRSLQAALVPLAVVLVALVIRSLKAGFLPVWVNAAVPIAACVLGAWIGLALLQRSWKATLAVAVGAIGLALLGLRGGVSDRLAEDTRASLQRIVELEGRLPPGEARFGVILRSAFAADAAVDDAVEHNRAAILALGIAVGHERLARRIGLDADVISAERADALRAGTTLRGREDWPRHFCLSAALAALEHPLVSDAGGLMKEQLDALTHGTGFSFGDLAADRAGVRFAEAATANDAAARALVLRLRSGFVADDFFPAAADLPENLTTERFRLEYGGVGSSRYRDVVADIERRLDRCAALSAVALGAR